MSEPNNPPQRGLWLACDKDGDLCLIEGAMPREQFGVMWSESCDSECLGYIDRKYITGPIPAPGTAVRVKVVVETPAEQGE